MRGRYLLVQEDAEAVSTAIRLAEAAADAEAAALVAQSGNPDDTRGSQAGHTGEDLAVEDSSTVIEKANEEGMVAARGGDLKTLRTLMNLDGDQTARGGFDPHTATDVHGK